MNYRKYIIQEVGKHKYEVYNYKGYTVAMAASIDSAKKIIDRRMDDDIRYKG